MFGGLAAPQVAEVLRVRPGVPTSASGDVAFEGGPPVQDVSCAGRRQHLEEATSPLFFPAFSRRTWTARHQSSGDATGGRHHNNDGLSPTRSTLGGKA